MTNVVPDGMPDESPRDALPADHSDWDEPPVETSAADAAEHLDADELELDESAILDEQSHDSFYAEPEPRTVEGDYALQPDAYTPANWTDQEAARLRISYYETRREPLESIDEEPLEFQQEESAVLHQNAPPILPLPDQVHAQIKQKLQQQQTRRFSLGELFGFTTFVAVILAAASWLPLNWYSLLLGGVTFGLLIAILKGRKGRYMWVSLITLLVLYIGSIVITIIRLNS